MLPPEKVKVKVKRDKGEKEKGGHHLVMNDPNWSSHKMIASFSQEKRKSDLEILNGMR